MKRSGSHGHAKRSTGTRLGTSDGRGWKGLLAQRWSHSEGELDKREAGYNEIMVLLEGRLSVRRRGDGRLEKFAAVPGTVALCPRGVREDMLYLGGKVCESVYLLFPDSPLSETALREFDVDPDKVGLRYVGGFPDPLIEQVARTIRAEMIDPKPSGKMLVETLTSALWVHILRHYSNLNSVSVPLPVARGALDPRRLRLVKDFIEAHLGEDLSIEALANEACLSPFHFARAFKAATGTAPHSYLTDRRMEKAKYLIAGGRIPIAKIACLCGFSSQAYFTTWFKRIVGTTPGAYRVGSSKCTDGLQGAI